MQDEIKAPSLAFDVKPEWSGKARGFLDALSLHGEIMRACEEANYSYAALRELRKKDPQFERCILLAKDKSNERIRDEIRRRAVDGWEEPVYQGGSLVGTKRKFSDVLLIFEAKKRMPEYRDSYSVQHSGSVDGNVTIYIPDNGRGNGSGAKQKES